MNIIRIIYNSTETGRVINQVKIPSRMSRITGHCTGYLLISFCHLIFTTSDEMRIFLTLQLVFHVQFLSELPASEIYQNYSTFLKRTSYFQGCQMLPFLDNLIDATIYFLLKYNCFFDMLISSSVQYI